MLDRLALDALLAMAHHVVVFTFTGLLVAEIVLVRVRLGQAGLRFLSRLDWAVGLMFFALAIVGVARVIWGIKPPDYYLHNWLFWAKMTSLSILSFFVFVPGTPIQRWHKSAVADPGYEVAAGELTFVHRALWVEVVLLIPVPVCAALMARGYGMF